MKNVVLRLSELGAKMMKNKPFIILGIIIVLSAFLTVISLILTPRIFQVYRVIVLLSDIPILAINFLPIFLLMSLLYFLINRIGVSYGLTGGIVLILVLINRTKLRYREDPLIMGDIFYISEAINITEGLDTSWSVFIVLIILIVLLVAVLTIIFLRKYKIDDIRKRGIGVLVIVICVIAIVPLYQNERIYNYFFQQHFGDEWNDADVYENRGVIYSFLFSSSYSFPTAPEGFDVDEARGILSQYPEMDFDKRVHIISIMLESYEDFSLFIDFDLENDPYTYWHELMDVSLHGRLVVPLFGGGTHLTERSFLTGYFNHHRSSYRRTTESFVQLLNRNGYRTVAMHPNHDWFYNRRNVMKNLGFDIFYSGTNMFFERIDRYYSENMFHNWMKDSDFFSYIINDFENAVASGEWYFNFSITIQNHSTSFYYIEETPFSYFESDDVSNETLAHFNEYLEGVRLTNEALRELHYYFSNHEEPVVLIIFGDHKPAMGVGGSGYKELGINISGDTPYGLLNRFTIPYIIYANNPAKEILEYDFVGLGPTISANYLFPMFFELSGMGENSFISFLNDLRREIPVIHHQFFKQGEELVFKLDREHHRLLREFNYLEYYLQHIH